MIFRHKLTYSLAVGLLALTIPAVAFQAPASQSKDADSKDDKKADQPRKASLSGTVLDALTAKPVKDANVLFMLGTGGGAPRTAKTDETGKFTFKDIDAGSYVLMGGHPKYARQIYGSRNGLQGATLLTILTGQEVKDLEFLLQPNAVASGRVLDEDGDPVPGIMVTTLKGMYQRGKRTFVPVGTAVTNDLGEYRVLNVAAGKYVLAALKMSIGAPAGKPAAGTPDTAFVTTYYPNVTDSTSAGTVEVTSGRDLGGLDIRIAKEKSVRIKGHVNGMQKDQRISVRLIPKGAGIMAILTSRTSTVNAEDGTFEIAGATRGSYILRASDTTGTKPMGLGVPVEVGERPIDNITVDLTPAVELNGVAVVKGDNAPTAQGARIMLESTDGLTIIPPNTTVGKAGAFTLKDVAPGKYLIRVMNAPNNEFLESASIGSQDIPDDGVTLSGVNPGKLELKLSAAGAQVDGVVRGKNSNPLTGITVALIPNSRRYMLYQTTFTDQVGAFSFKGVPPGDYKVIGWEEVEPNAYQDPEFLKPYESSGESVSLKENDRKVVTLKAIPRS